MDLLFWFMLPSSSDIHHIWYNPIDNDMFASSKWIYWLCEWCKQWHNDKRQRKPWRWKVILSDWKSLQVATCVCMGEPFSQRSTSYTNSLAKPYILHLCLEGLRLQQPSNPLHLCFNVCRKCGHCGIWKLLLYVAHWHTTWDAISCDFFDMLLFSYYLQTPFNGKLLQKLGRFWVNRNRVQERNIIFWRQHHLIDTFINIYAHAYFDFKG